MTSDGERPQWFDSPLFPRIFQTFRMAIQPSKIIIAFLAIAIICLAGWLMDFSRTVVATQDPSGTVTELSVFVTMPDQIKSYIEQARATGERTGVFTTLGNFLLARYHDALKALFDLDLTRVAIDIEDCLKAMAWAIDYHPLYCIVFSIITLAVFAVAGGAICRIAALQFAQGEKPGLTEAVRFGMTRFPSFLAAPLIPAAIILGAGVFIFVLGLLGNIPRLGEIIVGLSVAIAFVAGAFMALMAIGTIAGFTLMFPAIAYDGLDCYDAISRSFNYIYARPWRMGFYSALATIYGSICYIFVRFFIFLLILITRSFFRLAIWADSSTGVNKLQAIWPEPHFGALLGLRNPTPTIWSESLAAFLINIFLLVVTGSIVSFAVSFYFSANTIIYALMRYRVDKTPLEDICRHRADEAADTQPLDAQQQTLPSRE